MKGISKTELGLILASSLIANFLAMFDQGMPTHCSTSVPACLSPSTLPNLPMHSAYTTFKETMKVFYSFMPYGIPKRILFTL